MGVKVKTTNGRTWVGLAGARGREIVLQRQGHQKSNRHPHQCTVYVGGIEGTGAKSSRRSPSRDLSLSFSRLKFGIRAWAPTVTTTLLEHTPRTSAQGMAESGTGIPTPTVKLRKLYPTPQRLRDSCGLKRCKESRLPRGRRMCSTRVHVY